jgi:hypothetical protein
MLFSYSIETHNSRAIRKIIFKRLKRNYVSKLSAPLSKCLIGVHGSKYSAENMPQNGPCLVK